MYVRAITYSFRPTVTVDDAGVIYDQMLELLQPLSGYQGLSLLINEEAHRAVSMSYWIDHESATEAGAEILPLLMERTQDLVNRPPEVVGFELVRQDLLFE